MTTNPMRPVTWLRGNRRLARFALSLMASALLGLCLIVISASRLGAWAIPLVAFGLLLMIAAASIWFFNRPAVLTSDGRFLLLWPGCWAPIRIPLDVVECFFLGQGETVLPDGPKAAESSQIVLRIAERASDWQNGPLHGIVGRWHGGYITLSGLWCEPITAGLLEQLNRNLVLAHRARRDLIPEKT